VTVAVPIALVKPVGDRCNLACTHCFYHPGTGGAASVMEERTLAAMTAAFLEAGESPTIFAWQGGEPTLAGIDFYRRALELQRKLSRPGQRVVNTFQTNGVLIDEEWADFLTESNFLVGLSIDGPAACHDPLRHTATGEGSHARAVHAWRLLQRRGSAVNILCVVHQANQAAPDSVYRYLVGELGADYLQFIPCVEWTTEGRVEDFSLRPGEYGRFLSRLFDLWRQETERAVSVKLFDDLVLRLAGKPMRDCMYREVCDSHLVVERDGSVHPCDFFVGDEHRLGNVNEQTLSELRELPAARRFRERKTREAPAECADCRHRDLCHGGCCKFWRPRAGGGFEQYLCEDMRCFLDERRKQLMEMAEAIRSRWQQWGAAAPG